MMKRLFVTGTDTGVGKTFVVSAIARRARELGRRVFAFKPIETGCERIGNGLVGPDMETISVAAGDWQQNELRGMYRMTNAFAPYVAGKAEGVAIDLDRIVAVANSAPGVDLLIVEGAGGWRVPITANEDMAELAQRLADAVVVVARAGLGTINHTRLTIEAVERDGMEVAAVVMSRRPDEDLEFAYSNRDQIRRNWRGSVLILDTDRSILDPLL